MAAGCQLILLGPPGSGKSTLAARLADRLGLAQLDLGALLRRLAAERSALGREVRSAIADGRLVADELAARVVRDALAALPAEQGFVLVGYPRTAGQADALRRVLAELGRLSAPPTVVSLDAPRDELLRRLAGRRALEGRSDDAGETTARRMAEHDRRAAAVLAALSGWAEVVTVDADRPVDAVTGRIQDELRSRCPS